MESSRGDRYYKGIYRPTFILVGKLLLYSKVFSRNFFRRNFAVHRVGLICFY